MTPADRAPRVLLLFTEVFANGGIQRFNQTLLAALSGLNLQCDVLCMQDSAQSISRSTPQRNVNVTGFNGNRRRFALATARALWRTEYDWVVIGHVNLLSMAVAAMSVNFLSRTRTLLIAHGIEVWYEIGSRRRHAMRRVSNILCVSRYTRNRILEQIPTLQAERLRLFPNALGESWARAEQAPLSQSLPQRFILSVTRLHKGDRYKGVVSVIETLSMLQDASLQYMVVGQGDDLVFLERVARRCGVQHRVHFLAGISDDELINLYQQCEAFVLPSGKEGFGIVFLEAMYFGAPVIAAAEKGALDVVRDGENGLLVRFGDSMALKQAIERIGADAPLRERLRQTARLAVNAGGEFTFSRFVERTAEIFEIPGAQPA
jgi:phosphatidyl-myo-inositol dimannoside synthase